VVENWIQFSIMMLTFIAFLLRNEHRITVLEGQILAARVAGELANKRLDLLEGKLP
jgi:hypothetical protein